MTKRLVYSFAVILLAAVSVYAASPVTAQIPFSFHVGDSTLPSGSYTADTSVAGVGVICLRSADRKSGILVLSQGVQSSAGPVQAKLVFHRYGDEYFLFQVWTGTGDSGRELLMTRREAELAAAAKQSVRAVLAHR